jgi:hypothetical protein
LVLLVQIWTFLQAQIVCMHQRQQQLEVAASPSAARLLGAGGKDKASCRGWEHCLQCLAQYHHYLKQECTTSSTTGRSHVAEQ